MNSLLRVLIIEDSPLDAELMAAEFEPDAVEVHRVENEPELRRELLEFQPELVLADYRLPSFNGAAALKICRETTEAPVIIVSGTIGEEAAVELLKSGATDLVVKDRLSRLLPAAKRALREVQEHKARVKAQEDLRLLNQELEARIVERTRELQKKNELISEELRMARELQIALLPRCYPVFRDNEKKNEALRFFTFFQPSGAVSGDFFDIIKVSETQVGVLICDVMGHDVRAALVVAMMRALVGELGPAIKDPGLLLSRLNKGLCAILKNTNTAMFATAFYLLVDLSHWKVFYASAGHPSPFHLHRSQGVAGPLHRKSNNGIALGLVENATYQTYEAALACQDCLMLFTDGLFEIEAPNLEPFSQSRLLETVRANLQASANYMLSAIFKEIENFAHSKQFQDDVCLVGLEVGPFGAKPSAKEVSAPAEPQEALILGK